jgi:hypothetical protein
MYTLFTHQYNGAVCILFLGHSVYVCMYIYIYMYSPLSEIDLLVITHDALCIGWVSVLNYIHLLLFNTF